MKEIKQTYVGVDKKDKLYYYNGEKYIPVLDETGGGGGDIELKTINGQSIKGSGNISITTYQAFPNNWPTESKYTTKQFCDVVDADATAVIGMGYFGGAKWSDKPAGLANGDVVVEILEGPNHTKAIHLIMTSSTVAPYRWEYTYWSHGTISGWRGVQPELISGTNIKTINNQSILGEGNLEIQGGEGGLHLFEDNVTVGEVLEYFELSGNQSKEESFFLPHALYTIYYSRDQLKIVRWTSNGQEEYSFIGEKGSWRTEDNLILSVNNLSYVLSGLRTIIVDGAYDNDAPINPADRDLFSSSDAMSIVLSYRSNLYYFKEPTESGAKYVHYDFSTGGITQQMCDTWVSPSYVYHFSDTVSIYPKTTVITIDSWDTEDYSISTKNIVFDTYEEGVNAAESSILVISFPATQSIVEKKYFAQRISYRDFLYQNQHWTKEGKFYCKIDDHELTVIVTARQGNTTQQDVKTCNIRLTATAANIQLTGSENKLTSLMLNGVNYKVPGPQNEWYDCDLTGDDVTEHTTWYNAASAWLDSLGEQQSFIEKYVKLTVLDSSTLSEEKPGTITWFGLLRYSSLTEENQTSVTFTNLTQNSAKFGLVSNWVYDNAHFAMPEDLDDFINSSNWIVNTSSGDSTVAAPWPLEMLYDALQAGIQPGSQQAQVIYQSLVSLAQGGYDISEGSTLFRTTDGYFIRIYNFDVNSDSNDIRINVLNTFLEANVESQYNHYVYNIICFGMLIESGVQEEVTPRVSLTEVFANKNTTTIQRTDIAIAPEEGLVPGAQFEEPNFDLLELIESEVFGPIYLSVEGYQFSILPSPNHSDLENYTLGIQLYESNDILFDEDGESIAACITKGIPTVIEYDVEPIKGKPGIVGIKEIYTKNLTPLSTNSDSDLEELANAFGKSLYPLVGEEILEGDRVMIGQCCYTKFKGDFDSLTITALDIIDEYTQNPMQLDFDYAIVKEWNPEQDEYAWVLLRLYIKDSSWELIKDKSSRLSVTFFSE